MLKPLLVALDRRRAYGAAHPTAREAESALAASLAPVVAAATLLELQVARDTLLVGGVELEAPRALLAQLGQRLHKRGVGAITFEAPLRDAALHALLGHLVADPLPGGAPRDDAAWTASGIAVAPVRYDRLVLGESVERAVEDAVAACWRALAQIAAVPDGADDPERVAQALGRLRLGPARARAAAHAITTLAATADQLPAAREAVADRLGEVLARLGHGTYAAVVRDLADGPGRAAFLDAMHAGLPVDVVAEWLEVAAGAQQQGLSHHLLRLFGKLARSATEVPGGRAEPALRESARAIVADWSLDNPNPEEHMRLLAHITAQAVEGTPRDGDAPSRDAHVVEAERTVHFALETDCDLPVVRAAARAIATSGRLPVLLAWLRQAEHTAVAHALRNAVLADDAVIDTIIAEDADIAAADAVIASLGLDAADLLIDILGAARTRDVRRSALVRLRSLGSPVAKALADRLRDASPELARNLLVLLRDLDVRAPAVVLEARRRLGDGTPALRTEAVRYLARIADERTEALRRALRDDEPRVLRVAIIAAHDHGEALRAAAVPPDDLGERLLDLAERGPLDDRGRAGAILAAGAVGGTAVRDRLVALVARRSRFFGRLRLAPPTAAAVAALFVLRRDWRDDPEAAAVIALANAHAAADPRWLAVPVLPKAEERP